jgi:GNAT superfamily N-acetyltransferase
MEQIEHQSPHLPQSSERLKTSCGGCLVTPSASDRNTVWYADGWCLQQFLELPVRDFDCGDNDLNEYFREDAIVAHSEMLCETFALTQQNAPGTVLGLVSVCNDIVAVKNLRSFPQFRSTPEGKLTYKEWPAVKIARLGIRKEIQGNNIGSHLLNLLKTLFVFQNRTGCRVMTVDAYNKPRVLNFYKKNNFRFITEKDASPDRHTRSMWFDLLPWKNGQIDTEPVLGAVISE